MSKADDIKTWAMIHEERSRIADVLANLTPEQWAARSWCGDWTVQVAAGHIVAGAEQTRANFLKRMLANGFRFNRMIDRDARSTGARPAGELVDRLRATTSTTTGPPAPVVTMLGEIVVHGQDICQPLGIDSGTAPAAIVACLEMYKTASFPVGTKKRIADLRIRAADTGWAHGDGPEVSGPALALLSTITGRPGGLDQLTGDGLATLRGRMSSAGA